MASSLRLRRPARPQRMISVISMIDVMMILLFFFMVTSSYLNLDMVPAVQSTADAPPEATSATAPPAQTLLIRISATGQPVMAGRSLTPAALDQLLKDHLAQDPLTSVIVLPSGGARLQALVGLMDQITNAGIVRVKVVRLEAAP